MKPVRTVDSSVSLWDRRARPAPRTENREKLSSWREETFLIEPERRNLERQSLVAAHHRWWFCSETRRCQQFRWTWLERRRNDLAGKRELKRKFFSAHRNTSRFFEPKTGAPIFSGAKIFDGKFLTKISSFRWIVSLWNRETLNSSRCFDNFRRSSARKFDENLREDRQETNDFDSTRRTEQTCAFSRCEIERSSIGRALKTDSTRPRETSRFQEGKFEDKSETRFRYSKEALDEKKSESRFA